MVNQNPEPFRNDLKRSLTAPVHSIKWLLAFWELPKIFHKSPVSDPGLRGKVRICNESTALLNYIKENNSSAIITAPEMTIFFHPESPLFNKVKCVTCYMKSKKRKNLEIVVLFFWILNLPFGKQNGNFFAVFSKS